MSPGSPSSPPRTCGRTAPAKGTALLAAADRTDSGEELLTHAKDVLFALLFADESMGCDLPRHTQELLTLAVPRSKAGALDFMRASTELAAAGTWQDPESVSNDERADNVLLEVQYGEIEGELVGHGIVLGAHADQQPRGERAGPLRPDDQHRGDVSHPLITGRHPWSALRRTGPAPPRRAPPRWSRCPGWTGRPAGPGRAGRTAAGSSDDLGLSLTMWGVATAHIVRFPRVPG